MNDSTEKMFLIFCDVQESLKLTMKCSCNAHKNSINVKLEKNKHTQKINKKWLYKWLSKTTAVIEQNHLDDLKIKGFPHLFFITLESLTVIKSSLS